MTVMFVNDPKKKYKSRIMEDGKIIYDLPTARFYEYPVELKGGVICAEVFENIGPGLNPDRMWAVYRGLRRYSAIRVSFDPARLR